METCRWCGGRVSADDATCPHCGVRLRRERKRCPRCKEEIRAGLAVCPYCGEELAKKRIRWKLIGSVLGVVMAGIIAYVLLFVAPVRANLPFVAVQPSPTPTEVIMPPTETPTETPRPPTATATATATLTPVITETVTVTRLATRTPAGSQNPTGTPAATPTGAAALKYGAPQLIGPADGEQFNGSSARIELDWEPVGILADDEWYSISLSYENLSGDEVDEVVGWVKNEDLPWRIGADVYGALGADRTVTWTVRAISGVPGTGAEVPIGPPSESWAFRWQ